MSIIELNNKIKEIIQNNENCKKVTVTGVITNVKMSRGHLYLTLGDEEASISVVFWNYRFKNVPQNGIMVNIVGNICVYNKMGSYQLSGYFLKVIENNDDKVDEYSLYESMGYFNNKLDLPKIIKTVGLLTSKEGAAINDFRCVLENGKFKGSVYFIDTVVQGVHCPNSVVDNLQILDTMNLDVIVITRGGGSLEDLLGFSNPLVLEAINNTKTCIISAIGHESDTMLSDLVSDVRAPTPSVSAEIICKHQDHLNTLMISDRIHRRLDTMYEKNMNKLHNSFNSRMDLESNFVSYAKSLLNNKLDSEYKLNLNKFDTIKILDTNNNPITTLRQLQSASTFKIFFPDGDIEITL